MSIIRDGLVARAQAMRVAPQGERGWGGYQLVVLKKDVVSTGGQAFVEGHLAIAAPDRFEMRGEGHHLVFSPAREAHVAVADRDLGFLALPANASTKSG